MLSLLPCGVSCQDEPLFSVRPHPPTLTDLHPQLQERMLGAGQSGLDQGDPRPGGVRQAGRSVFASSPKARAACSRVAELQLGGRPWPEPGSPTPLRQTFPMTDRKIQVLDSIQLPATLKKEPQTCTPRPCKEPRLVGITLATLECEPQHPGNLTLSVSPSWETFLRAQMINGHF